ncbi:hypothetical protein CCR75_003197 [Bremia lactucae]|uniref:UBA domain-containing protein n=1 Tax=Bremia lactucae TaxID=4779 RepID=A0A976FMY2_BRELC|nr:hypothetical protein CCR75_003197 [Bremia lactucae]
MELDLNSRNAKWNREQLKRRDQAKRKLATEQRKRLAATKAREALELLQKQKRIERIVELERQEQQELEAQRLTGGIQYLEQLEPFPTTTDGDKITLPVSALEMLNPQNAFELGVLTFELSLPKDDATGVETKSPQRFTHAGVLEFTAREGTVGLPPKVTASLFQSRPNLLHCLVQVRYVRLEKGKFARLQPQGEGFKDRQLDLKPLLEQSLQTHTTLTEGDVVFVRHGRETFNVIVTKLKPEKAVTILNTDLEVDLIPCEAVAALQEDEKRIEEEAARAVALVQEKEQWKAHKLANLAPEPLENKQLQVQMILKWPLGKAMRRYCHAARLEHVFEFAEALCGEQARDLQLVTTYPRRVFRVDSALKTLQELALIQRQEVLFIEKGRIEDTNGMDEHQENDEIVTWDQVEGEWKEAREVMEKMLDQRIDGRMEAGIHAMEPILPVVESANHEQKWEVQLKELDDMGFRNRVLNIQALERYQGRLLRVVNYLSEKGTPVETND